MAEFSATDAAIEGFRLAGRKPGAVAIWSLAQFLVALVSGAAFVLLIGPDMQAMMRPEAAADWEDPSKALSMLAGAARVEGLALLVLVPWIAVMTCAVYRAVLRPQEEGFGYLRAGRDELRMLGLFLLFTLLSIGLLVGLIVVEVILSLLVGAGLAVIGHTVKAGTVDPLAVIVAMIVGLAPLLVFGWLAVRFSLAGPMTFAQRRLNLFGSWKLTRGHFWSLSGTYLISLILFFVLFMIGYPLSLVIGHFLTGEGIVPLFQSMSRPDFSSLQAYFAVPRLVVTALQALYAGLAAAVTYAPAAAAYQMLTAPAGSEPRAVASDTDAAREPTGPWG